MAVAFRADGRRIPAWVAIAAYAFVAAPLFLSVARVFSAASAASEWHLWWPSVLLAAGSASVALGLSVLGHWSLRPRAEAISGPVVFAVAVACALPSYVHALTWSWVLPEGLLERRRLVAACVLGITYAPVSFLALLVAFRAAPRQILEAAWLAGLAPLRAGLLVATRVVPAMMAVWLLAFLLGFSDFAVADHFRVATYATEIFARVAAWLDTAAAGRLALPVLLTGTLAVTVLTRSFARAELGTVAIAEHPTRRRGVPYVAGRVIAGLAFVALVAGVPIAALVDRLPSATLMISAVQALRPDLAETLTVGLVVGAVATILGAALSYLGVRRIIRGARFVRVAAWAALAWPASLVCLGAISLGALPVARLWMTAWLPMIFVLALRWLVLSYEIWWSFWMRLPVSLEESCWLAGMPWWQASARLLHWNGAVAFGSAVLLVACFSINDLTVFALLAPPGFSTTTLNIFSAVHYGPPGYLAALCLWQVILIAALATAAMLLLRRVPLGTSLPRRSADVAC